MDIVVIDSDVSGQCGVTFCIATDHNGGTEHVDVTGEAFTSCVHGNLTEWGDCRKCAEEAEQI